MTSKDLSRELCEICGIEYQIKCKHGEQFPQNCDCDYSCEECSAHQKIFPDFEKPENFTKLLNLPTETIIKNGQTIPAKNIWWIVNMEAKNCKALAPYCFEDLLIRVIVTLENKNKIYSDEFVNRIKQAIRETEWVYD